MIKKIIYADKTALVTGASSGLGAEFARQLAAQGADIILVARRRDRMEAVAGEIEKLHGVKTYIYTSDLSTQDAPADLYKQIKKDGLQVDILINNAGYGLFGEFDETGWDKTGNMIDLDIKALTHLTKLFLSDMKASNYGRILLVSSIAAYQPSPTYAAYAGAKAYVLLFGEAIRYELKKKGYNIHVSVLSPGVTETEFLQVAGQKKTLYQKMFMMQAPKVVKSGLRALHRNILSRIPGFMNKIVAFSLRFLPRKMVPPMAYRLMKNK